MRMNNEYYNYIKENISSSINASCFDYTGNDMREFIFDVAGMNSCADVTLQTMLDEVSHVNDAEIINQFATFFEEVKGEPLTDEENNELCETVYFHCDHYEMNKEDE